MDLWLASDLGPHAPEQFAQALALALQGRRTLRVVHTVTGSEGTDWSALPTIRALLERWGRLAPDASLEDYEALGVRVQFRTWAAKNPATALEALVAEGHPALLVMGTHRPTGAERLLHGSVAAWVARHADVPVLVLPDGASPLVDTATGRAVARKILVPVGPDRAQDAVDAVTVLGDLLGGPLDVRFLHVGPHAQVPQLQLPERAWDFATLEAPDGDIVGRILEAAVRERADLIAMATDGHDSLADALLGSRAERVLRESPVPMLLVGPTPAR